VITSARAWSRSVLSAGWAAGKCCATCAARMRAETWTAGCCT